MKRALKPAVFAVIILSMLCTSCTSNQNTEAAATDSVAANIKMYTHAWDEILNHGQLGMFNDSTLPKTW